MPLFTMKTSDKNELFQNEKNQFQIYFAGSLNKVLEQELYAHDANRLASQLLDRPVIESWLNHYRNAPNKGKLLIDSGAFSAHTKGAEIDVDAYIDFINNYDQYIHICAQVDKIPGVFRETKTFEQLSQAPELSWKNYLYMRDKLNTPEKLLPIFHQGEDFKWLHNMLEWTDSEGNHIPYIGISPANDVTVSQKIVYIDKCFSIILSSSNPNVHTHAFGMTSLYVLERYPFTSADSTSWIINGANGSIMTSYGSVTLSSGRTNAPDHLSYMPKAAQENIRKYVESKGFSFELLKEDYRERIKFNINFLLEWAKNYQCNYSSVKRRKLF